MRRHRSGSEHLQAEGEISILLLLASGAVLTGWEQCFH